MTIPRYQWIQIGSTFGPSGGIAPWILDGLWPAVEAERLIPLLGIIAGYMEWKPFGFTPAGHIIPLAVIGDGRSDADGRLAELVRTYPTHTMRMMHDCKLRPYAYRGCVQSDFRLAQAMLSSAADAKALLEEQMRPCVGSRVVLDKGADLTMSDAPIAREIRRVTGHLPLMEGWPRRTQPQAAGCVFMHCSRDTPGQSGMSLDEIEAARFPEKICLIRDAADLLGRDREEVVRELEGRGISVCMDWRYLL